METRHTELMGRYQKKESEDMEKAPGETVGGEVGQKRCSKCGEVKDFGQFPKNACRKDGCGPYCKKCFGVYIKNYTELNKEKIIKKMDKYRELNRYKLREYNKLYKKNNAEKINDDCRLYREKNREKARESVRASCERSRKVISPRYVKDKLKRQYGISTSECTPELIESKRKEILIKREIREVKKRLKEAKQCQ